MYRHPGIYFGDIHVLKATYVQELENIVGNAKHAIFFTSKGPHSIADEMGGEDFKGDLYWVSRNPQVGIYLKHVLTISKIDQKLCKFGLFSLCQPYHNFLF